MACLMIFQLMEKALAKLVTMKAQFGGMFAAMQGMMGASMGSDEDMFSRLESMKQLIEVFQADRSPSH